MTARRKRIVARLAALAVVAALAAPAQAVTTINVEVDWMATVDHTHQPTQAEINAVVQMFQCHGITLNVIVDQQVAETTVMPDGPDPNDFFTVTGPGSFSSYWNTEFGHLGQAGWHYCIFGHQYQADDGSTGSSGLGQTGGFAFVVTLGAFTDQVGTPFDRAATFAHELGHNLGLTHAGHLDPNVVGKSQPIYASIMSYMYQLTGVKTQLACLGMIGADHRFKDLDYSNGLLPNVDETALSEPVGIGIVPIDWDCGGTLSGVVAHDLQDDGNGRWCDASGSVQVLSDKDDWAAILSTLALAPDQVKEQPYEPCITAEEVKRFKSTATCTPVQPSLITESCESTRMVWVDANWGGAQSGSGSAPYREFSAAYSTLSPPGSVFYLQPGTHHCGAAVLDRPAVLSGPASCTIVP